MVPSIKIAFTLTGDAFDPELVTRVLGIKPTATWRKGEVVPRTTVRLKHDGWRIATEEVETVDLPSQVRRVLEKVMPHAHSVRKVCEELNLSAELNCIVYVDDEFPVIHFDRDILQSIIALNAEVDVDVMGISNK